MIVRVSREPPSTCLHSNPSISLQTAPIFVGSLRRSQGFRLVPREAGFHKPEAPAKESFPSLALQACENLPPEGLAEIPANAEESRRKLAPSAKKSRGCYADRSREALDSLSRSIPPHFRSIPGTIPSFPLAATNTMTE